MIRIRTCVYQEIKIIEKNLYAEIVLQPFKIIELSKKLLLMFGCRDVLFFI